MEHKQLLEKYFNSLINSIFKLLPLFEEDRQNYEIYLTNLIVEIHGNSQLFFYSENSIKMASILRGMMTVDNQKTVKRLTMECINLCKKIIREIKSKE